MPYGEKIRVHIYGNNFVMTACPCSSKIDLILQKVLVNIRDMTYSRPQRTHILRSEAFNLPKNDNFNEREDASEWNYNHEEITMKVQNLS